MTKKCRKKKEKRRNPAPDLTDDPIVDILSRLPVRSCAASSVFPGGGATSSPSPTTRGGFPRHLPFFHLFAQEAWHFTTVWETQLPPLVCPALSFRPGYQRVSSVLGSCNGLLLCNSLRLHSRSSGQAASTYVVCNPATRSWVFLPGAGFGVRPWITRLGFDPTVSLDFYVFEFIDDERDFVEGVQIYSSRTGVWSYKESEWDYDTTLYCDDTKSVFLNGLLHLIVELEIVAVDVTGETWWMVTVPDYEVDEDGLQAAFPLLDSDANDYGWEPGYLGQYQGQLCYTPSVPRKLPF